MSNCKQDEKRHIMFSSISSFIFGMGSVLDIYGSYRYVSFGKVSDAEKIRGDWESVGNDFWKSLDSATKGYDII